MTPYGVELLPKAADELGSLDRAVAERIDRRLRWLAEHFPQVRPEPLSGDLRGLFKLRVGSYRVAYSVDHSRRVLVVHLVGHRSDVYE